MGDGDIGQLPLISSALDGPRFTTSIFRNAMIRRCYQNTTERGCIGPLRARARVQHDRRAYSTVGAGRRTVHEHQREPSGPDATPAAQTRNKLAFISIAK